MLVHCVFFWLKEDMSPEEVEFFKKGLESLKEIPNSGPIFTGTAAATVKRPVIDDSYDLGLTCVFESIEEHDTYQEHEIHQKFLADCAKYFGTVKVYDFD